MLRLINETIKSLQKKEKKIIFICICGIIFLTFLPFLVAIISAPEGYQYSGFTVVAGADKMVYFSQIEEASQGNFLLSNLYTSEGQQAKIFSPLWWIIGLVSAVSSLSPLITFHLIRVILGFVFLILLYLFVSRIFEKINWRMLAFFVLGLGSGLGIFTVSGNWDAYYLYESLGTDLWVSEGNTFLTLYHSPLFIASQIMILLFFWWLIERLKKSSWPEAFFMGLMVLFLGLIHPYDYFIIFPVAYIWLSLRWLVRKETIFFKKALPKLIFVTVIASLAAFYFYWLKNSNPAFAGWLEQNETLSPKIFNYFIGYGLILIFYLWGIYSAFKSRHQYLFFLAVWSIVNWFLLFMPFQFQRRMANSLHITLSVIAVYGLWLFFKKINFSKTSVKFYVYAQLTLFFLVLTTMAFIGMELTIIKWQRYPYFIHKEQIGAYQWLKSHALTEDIILSSETTANTIPAYTGRTVYVGHGHQTADWLDKRFFVERFFATNDYDEFKYKWLKKAGIDYVVWTEYERKIGDFKPEEKDYLETVFKNEQVIISKIK